MKKNTFGIIVGNRGFSPDSLAKQGRKNILSTLKKLNYNAVCLLAKNSKFGSVESYEDAVKCAALFKKNADKIDGIIVSLPNFGDEKGIANSIRMSGLDVPVLIQAEPDDPKTMKIQNRRDSFCGKISVCNNLRQYGIPFTLTQFHTEPVDSDVFYEDVNYFAAVCRVVKGMRNTRVGAIGARPASFNTVRYSEKILEREGIAVETIDLSEIFGMCDKLSAKDKPVLQKVKEITDYVSCKNIPKTALTKMAKFGVVVDKWMKKNGLDISAVQCWTSMEEFLGVSPCTIMSMMSKIYPFCLIISVLKVLNIMSQLITVNHQRQ